MWACSRHHLLDLAMNQVHRDPNVAPAGVDHLSKLVNDVLTVIRCGETPLLASVVQDSHSPERVHRPAKIVIIIAGSLNNSDCFFFRQHLVFRYFFGFWGFDIGTGFNFGFGALGDA